MKFIALQLVFNRPEPFHQRIVDYLLVGEIYYVEIELFNKLRKQMLVLEGALVDDDHFSVLAVETTTIFDEIH
jgi:hypothetical protein